MLNQVILVDQMRRQLAKKLVVVGKMLVSRQIFKAERVDAVRELGVLVRDYADDQIELIVLHQPL